MATKRKTTTAIVAGVTAAAMLLGGTFAWTSISQQAKNEAIVDINPGGRLHDDFNGTNKDVYVENFGDTATGVDIYARIRLDQYFEVGQDAGINKGEANRKVDPILGTDINDVTTWVTYIPGDLSDTSKVQANGNWQWKLGNADDHLPIYLPTFNMNKDSLAADINGTYEGTVEGDIVHYDDYKNYTKGEKITGTEVFDWDDNDADEEENPNITKNDTTPRDSADVYHKEGQEHIAKPISSGATVMTMAEWIALGSPVGPYWVYDTDGWAYWAQPIAPGETTGLLLDGINMSKVPDDNYYYGINVVGQFATKGDIYMFDDMSDEAKELFATVSGSEEIVISGDDTVLAGGTATYSAVRNIFGETAGTQPSFTWSVNEIEGVTMENGTLTVDETVPAGTKITVIATAGDGTATADGETTVLAGTKTVIVEGVLDITATNNTTRYTPGTALTETFTATLKGANAADGTVTWTVADSEGNALTNTTITDGSLTIGTGETAPKIIVTATYKSNDGEIEFSGIYEVLDPQEIATTNEMTATAYAIVVPNEDGEGTKDFIFVRSFDSITSNTSTYEGKIVERSWVLDEDKYDLGSVYTDDLHRNEYITRAVFANTIKPQSVNATFNQFFALKSVEFNGNLDLSAVTDFERMFTVCKSLERIDMSGLKISTDELLSFERTFYECMQLEEVILPENIELSEVGSCFESCEALTTIIGLETWDVSKVEDFNSMFFDCKSLTELNITGWDTSSATNMSWMFQSCTNLTLDCSGWNVANVTDHTMFCAYINGVKEPTWVN